MSSRVSLPADKEIPSKVAPLRNPARSYAAIEISGSAHIVSPSKGSADQGFSLDSASAFPSPKVSTVEKDSDGFKIVTYRKKKTTGSSMVITIKHRRQFFWYRKFSLYTN